MAEDAENSNTDLPATPKRTRRWQWFIALGVLAAGVAVFVHDQQGEYQDDAEIAGDAAGSALPHDLAAPQDVLAQEMIGAGEPLPPAEGVGVPTTENGAAPASEVVAHASPASDGGATLAQVPESTPPPPPPFPLRLRRRKRSQPRGKAKSMRWCFRRKARKCLRLSIKRRS